MKWHKVSEELPKDGALVLLCVSPKDRPKWYPMIKLAVFKGNADFAHWVSRDFSRFLEEDLDIKLWCEVEYPLELSDVERWDRFELLDL